MLSTEQEVIEFVKDTMGASFEKVGDAGFSRAVTQASQELHWTLPISDPKKEYWFTERTKRYVIYILLIESAHKFQYKKISLQHRFQHYYQLLQLMDAQFAKALEEEPLLFDVGTYGNLGSYITVGFTYDFVTGEDVSGY